MVGPLLTTNKNLLIRIFKMTKDVSRRRAEALKYNVLQPICTLRNIVEIKMKSHSQCFQLADHSKDNELSAAF